MKIKKIPWWMPQVGEEELKMLQKAIEDNYVNEGNLCGQFEKKIANLVEARYAIATTSGTTAIFLALKALGVKHGDEVIVPDATFISTANAVEMCGAKPVLADIEPETLNIDPMAIEKAITKRTKAIVPVHVTGRAAKIEEILTIAKKYGLSVIEDAAEALMSKHSGKFLGTFGDAGCFSFSANKTISSGQGGMIVTNDNGVYAKLKPLKDQGRPVRGTGGDDLHNTVGYNFKYTDLQAAVGLAQLDRLQQRIKRMKRNYELYAKNLKEIKEIEFFRSEPGEFPQWTDIITERRDELADYLKSQNIDSRKYWLPIHKQLPYKLPDTDFPVSTALLPKSLWLPSAFTLTDDDILIVCQKIKEFFKK